MNHTTIPGPVTDCETCDLGCTCEIGTPGCEHWGCWGTDATNDCPAVKTHERRTSTVLHHV